MPVEGMRRELVWIERPDFWGWGCAKCAGVFKMAGSPIGGSIDEMTKRYEQRRDKEFASHVCAEHPRVEKPKS
jgi:hypothetical protein